MKSEGVLRGVGKRSQITSDSAAVGGGVGGWERGDRGHMRSCVMSVMFVTRGSCNCR